MKQTLTKLYPMVQFKKDTWEIDEFDVASMFLLIGEEKAMLIDCGMGIGDLRGAVEMLTDKPLITVLSHGHLDHTGNGKQFDELWMHPADRIFPITQDVENRRYDTERVAKRQKGCIGAPYTMFHLYPYDLYTDLRPAEEYEKTPVIHDLYDGQQFDLGGGRIVTAYECPGHSPGEMIFVDELTKTLFAGDALNFNLGVGSVPLETSLRYYKRMQKIAENCDGIYNGHHDFRALGAPLDEDCLPTVIEIMENALKGKMDVCEFPSFWGQSIPLTRQADRLEAAKKPMFAGAGAHFHKRVLLRKGRNYLNIDPENLYEEKGEKE